MGTMGTSGLTMTPSARTDCNKLALLSAPMGSPTPTMLAESVERSRLSVSVLINTSVNGHTPSAEARREVYKNQSQLLLWKRSGLTRIVKRLLYMLLWRKWRGSGMQYWIAMPLSAKALAMLFMKAAGSLRLMAGRARSLSQSCL